eukprot:TRINITY_DN9511_c0_g1_i3.p1 TRINITY_DN9511_c0_g1~~TRINITY_DN9511_c0_g1_i3.p1  ORF type:complete len:556 (-),score=142.36 TRINITY_DN9511_c0_g1_i3:90-1757(-)
MAATVKAKNEARLAEEKRLEERKKGLLVLIIQHLVDFNYCESAEKLQLESGVFMNDYEIADNIDLITVLQEYETYYQMKFSSKRPKLYRKKAFAASREENIKNIKKQAAARPQSLPKISSAPASMPDAPAGMVPNLLSLQQYLPKKSDGTMSMHGTDTSMPPSLDAQFKQAGKSKTEDDARGQQAVASSNPLDGITGAPALQRRNTVPYTKHRQKQAPAPQPNADGEFDGARPPAAGDAPDSEERPLLKPLPIEYRTNAELRELAATITRDIFTDNPNVRWTDVAGLDEAKRVLKESVVMPVKYPELFKGILAPWKGLLLFGPPGTGKTMLAKAVATECRTTFFNISASTVVSKWRGDSEKLIKCLFDLARFHQPSTIFLDEIDALMSHRGDDAGGEHEASRRMKTELLIQMDGLSKSNELVFVMCASNLPWMLDEALLRRLEKRIFVGLPDIQARKIMFQSLLPPAIGPNLSYEELAKATEGYSGSDIRIIAKEAAMVPVRRLLVRLEANENVTYSDLEPIKFADVQKAVSSTKPSTHRNIDVYTKWMNDYGSL